MTEIQRILLGISIAVVAVIYTTFKGGSVDKVGLISAAVTLVIIAGIGYWLYSKAKHTTESEQLTSNQADPIELEFIYHTGQAPGINSNKVIKECHHALVDMIVYGGDKNEFHRIIDTIDIPKRGEPNYIDRDKHLSYFFLLNEAYDKSSHHFFINLDWKEGVSDFRWHLQEALKGTAYIPNFPSDNKYASNASILYGLAFDDPNSLLSTVFEDYIRALNEVGLGLAFLETQADYFVVFMYRFEDRGMIQGKVGGTGLYFGSPK